MAKCFRCDKPVVPNRVLCKAHLEYHRKQSAKYRAKRRSEGQCIICGAKRVTKSYCQKHREQQNERTRKRRIVVCTLCAILGHHRGQHKKLGLCWHCPKKVFKDGLCRGHLNDRAERHRESSRSLREKRQASGVCLRCGKPSGGKTLCPPHLTYMAEWQRLKRQSS